MAIEQPNRPLTTRPDALISLDLSKVQVLDTGDVDISGPEEFLQDLTASFEDVEHDPYTIGWFYDQIARSIIRLDHHGSLFTGDPDHQLTPAHWPGAPGRLYRITDKTSALLAIHQITREGEGTSHTDPIGDPHQLAHYYRFQEIVEGRHLRRDDGGQWKFDGSPIVFDPAGVFPMMAQCSGPCHQPQTGLMFLVSNAPEISPGAGRATENGVKSNLLTCENTLLWGWWHGPEHWAYIRISRTGQNPEQRRQQTSSWRHSPRSPSSNPHYSASVKLRGSPWPKLGAPTKVARGR